MILLVDVNALLWSFADAPTLDQTAARSINDPDNDVLVSAGTVWEIEDEACRRGVSTRRRTSWATLSEPESTWIPITAIDAFAAAHLPTITRIRSIDCSSHRRFAWTRRSVSRDRAFDAYGVPPWPPHLVRTVVVSYEYVDRSRSSSSDWPEPGDSAALEQGRLAARKIGTQHIIDEADLEALDDNQIAPAARMADGVRSSPMPNVVRAVRLSRAGH